MTRSGDLSASNADLLRPSLQDGAVAQPPYSVGALIAAAFFGGAIAVTLIAAANARRQRRLARDLPWLVVTTAIGLAIVSAPVVVGTGLVDPRDTGMIRIVYRAVGFAMAGAFFLLHRKAYRTVSSLGLDPPSPYVPVLFAVLASIGVAAVLRGMLYSTWGVPA